MVRLKLGHITKYECKKCGDTFGRKSTYDNHILTHSNTTMTNRGVEYKFRCDKCTKGFATKQGLRRHSFIHEGKYHHCPSCIYSFSTVTGLIIHRVRKHGYKAINNSKIISNKIECDFCSISFITKYGKIDHVCKNRDDKLTNDEIINIYRQIKYINR